MASRDNESTVTIRISAELKGRVEQMSRDLGISQNAVWKILIARYVRPALDSDPEALLRVHPAAPAGHAPSGVGGAPEPSRSMTPSIKRA